MSKLGISYAKNQVNSLERKLGFVAHLIRTLPGIPAAVHEQLLNVLGSDAEAYESRIRSESYFEGYEAGLTSSRSGKLSALSPLVKTRVSCDWPPEHEISVPAPVQRAEP